MTNAELLAKIKAQIELLYDAGHDSSDRWDMGWDSACEKILDFIYTLEKESTNTIDIIRKEIERRISISDLDNPIGLWSATALTSLLSFLSTLESEKPIEVGEDFEKEYAKFSNDPDAGDYAFPIDLSDYRDFAHHFYELGRQSVRSEKLNEQEVAPRMNDWGSDDDAGMKQILEDVLGNSAICRAYICTPAQVAAYMKTMVKAIKLLKQFNQ